jgi:Bifunctional DNA primase/polymerase, N-terminal
MTPLEIARDLLRRGWQPVAAAYRSKRPVNDGWPDVRMTEHDLGHWFNGQPMNVGVHLGTASGGLIDVDLDSPEAVRIATAFLPATGAIFGRAGKRASHWLYYCEPVPAAEKLSDVLAAGGKAAHVEIRSDRQQTIAPGSVHESGEPITWDRDGVPANVDADELRERVVDLATTATLMRHWPVKGERHDGVLAAAGFLLGGGVGVARATIILVTVARAMDPDADLGIVRRDVAGTALKIDDGEVVVGGTRLAALLTGDGRAVVRRLRQWLRMAPAGEPRWQAPKDRPEIDTGGLGLAEMANASWSAIEAANAPPRAFRYGTGLAWLSEDTSGRPQIEPMHVEHVRHHLADVATFTRWVPGRPPKKKPAFPPTALAVDLIAVPRRTLPRLSRVVHVPVFAADGRLLTEPGFDAASGIYVAVPPGLTIPSIPESPASEDVDAARTLLLDDLLGDFPFVNDADRAHALALLLTLVMRELVAGDVPMFLASKPTPRTGASLLVRALSVVVDGVPIGATTASKDEEEMRKRLTATLLSGPALVLIDNLHGRLDSAALAAILTCGGTWRDRMLGKTQELSIPVRATVAVTGNNPSLSNEIAGRTVLVRLDPKLEDPSTRTGFQHADLIAWTTAHRGELLAAALTIGQAWVAAGMPAPAVETAFGGYEPWARALGGVLEIAEVGGFLENRRLLFEQADTENAPIVSFLEDWWTAHGERPVLVKELVPIAKESALPIEARNDHGMGIRLGLLIQGLEDRQYALGAVTIQIARDQIPLHRAIRWRLRRVGDGGRVPW